MPRQSSALGRIGPYILTRELARGGMGVVYEGWHVHLQQHVAVKLVPHQGADPRELERFLAEARTASRIRHPNVVGVHDAGLQAGQLFLVMDLVSGESLQQRLDRDGPLTAAEAAEIVLTLARALSAAHGSGVLHRDLKPDNVLLDLQGRPLLTDFGVAKDLLRSRSLTDPGEILGTPSHMAPEQANGQRADVRTDVYGLGATLYHLLCGRAPFDGTTLLEVLTRVMGDAVVPPSDLIDLPADLEAICLRCLEKDPEQRYANASELALDLERFLKRGRVLARRLRPGRRSFTTAGVLVLAGLGTWGWLRPTPTPHPNPVVTTAPPVETQASSRSADLSSVVDLEGSALGTCPQLEVEEAWLVTLDPRGARLRGRGTSRPSCVLPLSWVQGPLEVEAELDPRLEAGSRCDVLLMNRERGATAGFAVEGQEGGATRAILYVRTQGQAARLVSAPLPFGPHRLRLTLGSSGVVLSSGDRIVGRLDLPHALPPGEWDLRVGLNHSQAGSFEALCDVRVRRLRLRALEGGAHLRATRGDRADLGRLGRRVAAGQRKEARPRLLRMGRNPDGFIRQRGFYLLAVTEDGPDAERLVAERISLLWEVSEHGALWFQRQWRADLHLLPTRVRQALVREQLQALRKRGTTPEALCRVAAKLILEGKDPAGAALLFEAAGETAQNYPLERGLAWARSGDFDRALLDLAPLEQAKPGRTRGEAGRAAFRAGRYRLAVELWREPGPYGQDLALARTQQ